MLDGMEVPGIPQLTDDEKRRALAKIEKVVKVAHPSHQEHTVAALYYKVGDWLKWDCSCGKQLQVSGMEMALMGL